MNCAVRCKIYIRSNEFQAESQALFDSLHDHRARKHGGIKAPAKNDAWYSRGSCVYHSSLYCFVSRAKILRDEMNSSCGRLPEGRTVSRRYEAKGEGVVLSLNVLADRRMAAAAKWLWKRIAGQEWSKVNVARRRSAVGATAAGNCEKQLKEMMLGLVEDRRAEHGWGSLIEGREVNKRGEPINFRESREPASETAQLLEWPSRPGGRD